MSSNVATELIARLREIRLKAMGEAPAAAATAAGRAGETMVKILLTRQSHGAGTPTPSAPGQPPAKISGDLARSVQRTKTIVASPGVAVTAWGPLAIYGPVQEYGATISVKTKQVLANYKTGQVFGTQVTIPARPFMKPGTDALLASGTFTKVQQAAWIAAIGL